MNGFWRHSRATDLERELVRHRPAPRDGFVAELAQTLDRPRRGRTAMVGTAVAFAGLLFVGFGAAGAGYAFSSGSHAANVAGVHLNQSTVINHGPDSSGHAQYGPVPVPPFPPPTSTTPTTPPTPPSTSTTTTTPTPPPTSSTGGGGPFKPPPATQPSGGQGNVSGNTQGKSQGTQNSSSGLPFTGISLVFPVLLGAALILLGVFLRRRGRITTSGKSEV
jgi:hypothetical protein